MARIIGTADHRRRIHRHKQRALICHIPHGYTALPTPPVAHSVKISYLAARPASGALARRRVDYRAPYVGGEDRYTVPVRAKDALRYLKSNFEDGGCRMTPSDFTRSNS
jgi:hypothetical protein